MASRRAAWLVIALLSLATMGFGPPVLTDGDVATKGLTQHQLRLLWRAPEPDIAAPSAILVNPTTGRILFARNERQRRAPASLTKIVTALVALQRGRLDSEFVITGQDMTVYSMVGLQEEEEFTLNGLLHILLIPSDNASNLTVHSGIDVDPATFRQPEPPAPRFSEGEIGDKVFACFAFSDADNYSIPMGTYPLLWEDPTRGEVPLAWGLPCTIPTLAPGIAAYYYEGATGSDRFIAMCGVGYAYPSLYRDRTAYIDLTARYMEPLDLHEIWLLDPTLMVSAAPLLDDFLVEMAGAVPDFNGVLSNYFRSLAYSGYAADGTPYLYSVYSYPDEPRVDIPRVIDRAVVLKRPGEPVFLFFGLNAWRVSPSDVAAALEAVARPEVVEAVSVPESFVAMRAWR